MSATEPAWTGSTRDQIRTFYGEEFPERLDSQAPPWVSPDGPAQFAAALSTRYPKNTVGNKQTVADFIRRDTRATPNDYHVFDDWEDVIEFFRRPAMNDPYRSAPDRVKDARNDVGAWLAPPSLVDDTEPVADAAYYGLAHNERWWVLAFDIDAKDIATAATNGTTIGGNSTADSAESVQAAAPSGFAYRYEDIDAALSVAADLRNWLQHRLDAETVRIFYSGQGTHVYVEDADTNHRYTKQSREFLVEYLVEHEGYPLDEQVTADDARVMRLPGSLHTDVSRVVTEVTDITNFDYRTDATPVSFVPGDKQSTQKPHK
jgi:hypothetical protein